jgi:mannonate dehydratase
VIKTQGFVSGNFSENDEAPIQKFREFLNLYKGIDKKQLRENMKYFLEAIMPTCEEYGMNMCVHPDDPPIEILGLPRIVRTEEDIQWFLDAVPNKHNGLTFCAGSLSAGAYNNVVDMARKFAPRTHFVHLRSCHIFPNGDFTEASHLGGRADLIELARIFEKQNPQLPMRVDHGMTMLGDEMKGYNAGYSFLGRMFALGQVQGILATVDRELGIEYKQPGFFD